MNAARYCFLLLALLFRKIATMRISHRERSNHENTYYLLYFAGILFKGLCLNRRYIIHFEYSVSGFGILELTKSREWVLSTLVGQKRPFLLLFRAYWKRSCVRICRFGGHELLMMSTHSARCFLVAVTLITIVTVKPHHTMGKGGRWVQALSPWFPWKAENFEMKQLSCGSCMSFQHFDIISTVDESHRPWKMFFWFVSHLKFNMTTINYKITVHSPKVAISQRTTPKDQLWEKPKRLQICTDSRHL